MSMIFSQKLALARIIDLCRALRHNLAAGITLRAVFQQQAVRGPREIRPLASRVSLLLEQGEGLTDSLEKEKALLPPLFLSLTRIGEETGNLPEIYAELENYYTLQQRLRRQFRSQIFLPVIQFVLALFVIAGLIMIMGLLAGSGKPLFTLFGLTGPRGALIFLVASFGSIGLLYLAYRKVPDLFSQKAAVDALLLRIPALGPCLYALAMGRFCLALQLTMGTGMTIMRALRLSLKAPGNAAFAAQAEEVAQALKNGEPLVEALSRSGLFSVEFLNIVAVGEESGRIVEVMKQQAEYWHEEASRKMTILTRAASLAVWLLYAIFMVVMIFKIFSVYVNALGGK
jgi:type II secretory pathway component PulF